MSRQRLTSLFRRKKDQPAHPTPSHSYVPSYGIKVLAEDPNSRIDVVAVHGLNGDREATWTAEDTNWLRDFLPSDTPPCRIMSWGYDARTHGSSPISRQHLYDHGRTLVSDLCLKRKMTQSMRRPIIFVAHSLGGIVVKSALIHSDGARPGALQEHKSIKLSTYGIVFMGTPHQGGSGVQLAEIVVNVASIFVSTSDRILQHLREDSEWLQQQLGQYSQISGDFMTKFAYETLPTPIAAGRATMIVPMSSAVVPGASNAEPIAIHADHRNMVRFGSKEDPGYKTISSHLQIMAEAAPAEVQRRWEEHDRAGNASGQHELSLPFGLPGVTETETFIGREKELSSIRAIFKCGPAVRKVAVLYGLGGIGKTQLAARYAKQYNGDYLAVIWLYGKDADSVDQSYANAARRLLNEHPRSAALKSILELPNASETASAMVRWLERGINKSWLLVFDNVDDPKLPGRDGEYDIARYLPTAEHGHVMVTTRVSSFDIGTAVPVKQLADVKEGLAVIAAASRRPAALDDPDAAALVRRLDGLPLALWTAGGLLRQTSMSFATYLREYEQSWHRVQDESPRNLSYQDYTLRTTWGLSLTRFETAKPAAAALLRLWGYFDNQDLWYELIAAGQRAAPELCPLLMKDELDFHVMMKTLGDHCLAEPRPDSGGYSCHSCVHDWIRNVLVKHPDQDIELYSLLSVGYTVPGRSDTEYWILQRRLLAHASRLVNLTFNESGNNQEKILYVLPKIGNLYADQGKLDEAEKMYVRALQGFEKVLGPDHTSTLDTVNNLGILYAAQGKLDEAEKMYVRALQGKEKALGPDHTSTLGAVNNLGLLYAAQGKLDEAEKMYVRALQGKEKALGPDHTSTLATVNNLGLLYASQVKLDEAEKMYRRALQGSEKALGPDHTSTLKAVNNLGLLYKAQGKLDEAEKMCVRALQGIEKALGPDHTSTLETVNNLGGLYADQGKLDEAEKMYVRALQGKEKALGPDHTSTLETVNNLGAFYADQGKLDEAEKVYTRALQGKEKALGPDHTSTLDTVNNLGLLYKAQGKLDEAEKMYVRALQGFEKALGPDHTSTLATVNNLGLLYASQVKLDEAEKMYRRALQGSEKALGPDHTSTLKAVNNLGLLYKAQGKLDEAEKMCVRALQGFEKALGPDHTSTLATVNSLGLLYASRGMLDEAEKMCARALQWKEKALGPDHTSTLNTVNNLGGLYADQGKLDEAEKMYTRALAGYRKSRGDSHPTTELIRRNLAALQ